MIILKLIWNSELNLYFTSMKYSIFFWEFQSFTPVHLSLSPSISAPHSSSVLLKGNLKKNKNKIKIKNNKKEKHFTLPSFPLSIAFSFILVELGASVYHGVYSFVQTAFLANVLCVRSCWSDSWPLALVYHHYWTPTDIPLWCPAVAPIIEILWL